MDKLSTKLRLVRSQSMGVGMGGSGLAGGNNNNNNNNSDNKMSSAIMRRTAAGADRHMDGVGGGGGRSAAIVLLDERRLEMLIQPRLYAGELLDLVASHCNLKEKEYFGLAVVDESGHYTWLQLDRKVLDHDLPRKPAVLTVHFLVKFFIESMAHLSENKTIELFYLQARSLIFRGTLEVESDIVFQLAALSLQSSSGNFVDDTLTRSLLKKSPILPANVLKENPSLTHCEDQVIEHYKKMRNQTRGQAVVNYMTIVESMPTYGVHYFEVYDKRQMPWWLGLSCRGIAQYSYSDRKVPVRVFPWKQLENLYFRDKKFSIEVHDAKRVVQTLSSFNLYEDALKLDAASPKDELVDAIADSTTQVSVSRRSFNPGAIHVYVWFGKTQGLTKCIWQSAISQHQFYLDRKQAKLRHNPPRTLKDIARDLTQSSTSLSSASSLSNLSRTESTQSLSTGGAAAAGKGSTGNLAASGSSSAAAAAGSSSSGAGAASQEETELQKKQSEEAKRARMEMVAALKARREALEAKLKEKTKMLKELCIKEGELTGELPPDIPLSPGEPVPQIRRRVGTEFALSEKSLLKKSSNPEEELLASLELEYEIQGKITSAALKLANDPTTSKSVRKQRKISYQQSLRKLKEIENKLNALKYYGTKHKRKQPRPPNEVEQSQQQQHQHFTHGDPRDIRRGISVPDLEISRQSESPISLGGDDDDVDGVSGSCGAHMSPRSCPASPRKNPGGSAGTSQVSNHHHRHPDSVSLESSPQRMSLRSGFIPSSVYLRSSYRTKQYPTLSTVATKRFPNAPGSAGAAGGVAPLLATTDMMMMDSSSSTASTAASRSATLPTSPFRNKYESHLTQCDSPVGLYNCPQQRTSQAFSSMDDLDAMLGNPGTSQQQQQQQQLKPQQQQQHQYLSHQHHLQQQQHLLKGHSSGSRLGMKPSAPPPFPVRLEAAAQANSYPSLERSIRKQSAPGSMRSGHFGGAGIGFNPMANRELPALPTSNASSTPSSSSATSGVAAVTSSSNLLNASKKVESARSMEDLESLEASGIRGRSKMHYREVMNGGDTVSLADAAAMHLSNKMSSRPHHLPNTDEYPAHHSPSAASSKVGSHNMLGIRPLDTGGPYPSSHGTTGTLLPGQTYPEPSAKPLLASSSIASLQEAFYQHRANPATSSSGALSVSTNSSTIVMSSSSTSSSVISRKVETTFGLNDSIRTESHQVEGGGGGGGTGNTPPPPLYPKQYHQVVQQRLNVSSSSNSSGVVAAAVAAMPVPPRSIVSESPAVNRRVKPVLSTPPPLPPISSSAVAGKLNDSFETVPESPSKSSLTSTVSSSGGGGSGKFVPFHRESTKPFEMSDFYKYSTKFRKSSTSSLKSVESSGTAAAPTTNSGGGSSSSNNNFNNSNNSHNNFPEGSQQQQHQLLVNSESDSPRSSTASGSSSSQSASAALSSPPEIPQRTPTKPKKDSDNNLIGSSGNPPPTGDLADDFTSEMIAWYNSTAPKQKSGSSTSKSSATNSVASSASGSNSGKPATLV